MSGDRLWAEGAPDPETPEGLTVRIEKLLEEGDSEDLRRLTESVSEQELAAFLDRRGGRRLSTRGRLFWAFVLGRPAPEPHPLTEKIWPL